MTCVASHDDPGDLVCGEVMVTQLCVASHEFITELRRENNLSKLLP